MVRECIFILFLVLTRKISQLYYSLLISESVKQTGQGG